MTLTAAHSSETTLAATAGESPRAVARCAACQLQLCKSRDEGPHAQLKEIRREELSQSTVYGCGTCGTTLTRSADVSRPGWAQQSRHRVRPAPKSGVAAEM